MGIHETTLQWINILSLGTRLDHSSSTNLYIGMPQGYILGLLLFVIYINDIINSSNILSFVFFAVDTTVYVQLDSIDGAIQILTRN